MKNEVGDKSPNEVALSVLIEGDTFARQNKLHNRKNLRANPLVLFRLFLLSPKSLLRNTFRGPRHRFALIRRDKAQIRASFARPMMFASQVMLFAQ